MQGHHSTVLLIQRRFRRHLEYSKQLEKQKRVALVLQMWFRVLQFQMHAGTDEIFSQTHPAPLSESGNDLYDVNSCTTSEISQSDIVETSVDALDTSKFDVRQLYYRTKHIPAFYPQLPLQR